MNELFSKALSEISDIKSKLMTLEETLQTMANTPAARVKRLLSRLGQFLADAAEDPTVYKCDTAWAEVEDLAEDLGPVKDHLQEGLFRKVMMWLRDSRERLKQSHRDAYAINQLQGLAIALSNTQAG